MIKKFILKHKVYYNLELYGLDTSNKNFIDNYGNILILNKLNDILSIITTYYYNSEHEYATIHSDIFAKKIKNYRKYLNWLLEEDLIHINNFYIVGVQARSYMFTNKFKKISEIIDIKFVYNKNISKNNSIKIDKKIINKLKYSLSTININYYVNKEIKNNYIDFKKYIKNIFNVFRCKVNSENSTPLTFKNNRIYTPFVYCSKNIRSNNFYYINKLKSIDIPNSFPLFLSIWCIKKGIDVNDIYFRKFISLVTAGRNVDGLSIFYLYMSKKFREFKNSKEEISYKLTKKDFNRWLNMKLNLDGSNNNNYMDKAMKKYFPSIYNLVDRSKYKMYDELVYLESSFIINVISKIFNIRGVKILSCHDEIYFDDKYEDDIINIWNIEFDKLLSILPEKINVLETGF